MFNIQEIAKKGKPGDRVHSNVWKPDLSAEIVQITEEGVLLKGEYLFDAELGKGQYLARFAQHNPEWKTWALPRRQSNDVS